MCGKLAKKEDEKLLDDESIFTVDDIIWPGSERSDSIERLMYLREPYPHTISEALWMARQRRLLLEMRRNPRFVVSRVSNGW